MPGNALLRYTVPMPDDSLIPVRATEKVALTARFCLPYTMVGLGGRGCVWSGPSL